MGSVDANLYGYLVDLVVVISYIRMLILIVCTMSKYSHKITSGYNQHTGSFLLGIERS